MRIELKQGKEIYLPNGNTIYIGDCIGKGGSSLVYEVFEDKQLNIIRGRLKEYYPFENAPERIENGELIFHNNSHDLEKELFQLQKDFIDEFDKDDKTRNYFPQLVELFKANNTFYLFTSYSVDETLPQYLKHNSSITTIVAITLKICKFVKILHEHGYLHLDIKDSNFGVEEQGDDFYLRIFDFGSFSEMSIDGSLSDSTQLLSYSKAFSAPEIFSPQKITRKTDYYSLGVLLIHLLTEGEKNALKSDDELLNDVIPSIKQKFINSGEFTDQEYYLFEYIEQFIKSTVKYKPDDRCDDIDELIGFLDNFLKKNPFTKDNVKQCAIDIINSSEKFKYKIDPNLIPEGTCFKDIFINNGNDVVRCVHIFGEGGLGKSNCCKRLFDDFSQNGIAIYIPLKNFKPKTTENMPYQSIIDELQFEHANNIVRVSELKVFLEKNASNILIIFDGLNEFSYKTKNEKSGTTNQLEEFEKQLEEFAKKNECKIVITDRTKNSQSNSSFVNFEFPHLSNYQVDIALNYSKIENLNLYSILHIPFYLNIFINNGCNTKIKTKYELLNDYYYPSSKHYDYINQSYKEKKWFFDELIPFLAYELLVVRGIRQHFSYNHFRMIYIQYTGIDNEKNVQKIWELLIETKEIFVKNKEISPDNPIYSFSHQTIEEFFACKFILVTFSGIKTLKYKKKIYTPSSFRNYSFISKLNHNNSSIYNVFEFVLEGLIIADMQKELKIFLNSACRYCCRKEKNRYVIVDDFFELLDNNKNFVDIKRTLLNILLNRSVVYDLAPYSVLCYIIPKFNWYIDLVRCIDITSEIRNKCVNTYKKLSLIRDICFIYGLYNRVFDVSSDTSDLSNLFNIVRMMQHNKKMSIRDKLNMLFYELDVNIELTDEDNVYPLIFNPFEAKLRIEIGIGITKNFPTKCFDDDIKMFNFDNSDCTGLVTYKLDDLDSIDSTTTGIVIKPSNADTIKINEYDLKSIGYTKNNIEYLSLPDFYNFNGDTCKYDEENVKISLLNLKKLKSIPFYNEEGFSYYYKSDWFAYNNNIFKGIINYFIVDDSLIIPKGITEISKKETEKIDIPCVNFGIYVYIFKNIHSRIKQVIFNDEIKTIGEYAFYNFSNLSQVCYMDNSGTVFNDTLPPSLKIIKKGAFGFTKIENINCSNLDLIIEDGSFECCEKLTINGKSADVKILRSNLSSFYLGGVGGIGKSRFYNSFKTINWIETLEKNDSSIITVKYNDTEDE